MYISYRVVGERKNERSLLCRYITIIIVASTVSATMIITANIITDRNTLDLADRQYAYYYSSYFYEGRGQLPVAVILNLQFTQSGFLYNQY